VHFLKFQNHCTLLPIYVSAALDFSRPNTAKELQGFLGLLNFYRSFLPSLGCLEGDKKGVDVLEWSVDMEAAFTASKKALASAMYLAHPLPGAVFSLSVDASVTHIGAGLHQRLPDSVIWEPLGFFSKKLEPVQTRDSAVDRELLSCSAGIRRFRHMSEYCRFSIFTDHQPLTYALSTALDPWTAWQARQLSYVAEYKSDICHVAGFNNVVPGTLSRPPAPNLHTGNTWCSCARLGSGHCKGAQWVCGCRLESGPTSIGFSFLCAIQFPFKKLNNEEEEKVKGKEKRVREEDGELE
jgi:hypothetical protein